jgi:hypothetical protein
MVFTSKEFPARISIIISEQFVSMETSNNFQFGTVYYKRHWKENLERRLSAIYKKDYVLQYDQS